MPIATDYFLLKTIHIVAAMLLGGTGLGIAYFMFMVSRTKNIQAIAMISQYVVLADWLFTTPAVIVQFVTGIMLMQKMSIAFSSLWFVYVASLFIFIGCCWLPVVFLQYRLRHIANHTLINNHLPPEFYKLLRIWTLLGIPAFTALLVIIGFMVYKPFLTDAIALPLFK